MRARSRHVVVCADGRLVSPLARTLPRSSATKAQHERAARRTHHPGLPIAAEGSE
jgi:hypothetical protein